MQGEELPDYKQNFLREMEQLRQQEWKQQQGGEPNILAQPAAKPRPQVQNNIINTAQYSQSNWKNELNQSSYNRNHNLSQYQLSLKMNPEIAKKQNNIQSTPISEYSNAMHNKTVFINPKNTSC